VELLFLTLSAYAVLKENLLLYALACSLCLLTREPSAMLLLPVSIAWMAYHWTRSGYLILSFRTIALAFGLFMPFLLSLLWKLYLMRFHGSSQLIEGGNNLGFPLYGIYQGLKFGILSINNLRSAVEMTVWLLNFCWILWLSVLAYRSIVKDRTELFDRALTWSWYTGLLFALLFSYSIYLDDWSFARVLSGYNFISFLLIIRAKRKLPKSFLLYTFAVFSLMVGRLWLRV
jgi:hypothetical protein